MELGLTGKAALVTGASRGIGRAIAQSLHREGARVALNARNMDSLADAAGELPGSIVVPGDVTCPEDARNIVLQTLGEFGALDILVCNVGSGRSVSPGKETPDEWQRVFALNLWSTTNTVEAGTEALVAAQGTIVCVSSICGTEVIAGAPVTYSAAKAALNAYVRGIARPLGHRGVRINAVAPGNIRFDGSVWERKMREDPAAVQAMLEQEVALKRLGSPEDIAQAVCLLASPLSRFTTGTVWTLDGGQLKG